MNRQRGTTRRKPAKIRAILLISIAAAAVIVSTAILTRERPESAPEKNGSTTTNATTASQGAGFTVVATDDLNFQILRDGQPVLIMKDGYRVRFRCNPANDHWVGTKRTPVHLGWSPWDAADVSDVRVDRDISPDRFKIGISGRKPQLDNVMFTTTLLATRDIETGRISYSILSDLNASPAEVKNALGAGRIEYLDPWIEGIFWPQRDDHDRELYDAFVFFDAETQKLMSTPKLHIFPCLRDGSYETLVTPLTTGALAAVDKTEPGLRFLVADLSGPGTLGICWWTWDPHFYIDLDNASGNALSYAMRIEEIPRKTGERMLADAEPIPFQSDPEHQLPSFSRDQVNRFDDMLDQPDEWSWEQHSRACEIDRTVGYDDKVCVTIKGSEHKTTAWYTRALGYDFFDHATLQAGQSVSAYIRTQDATAGARLGVLCYNGPESWLYDETEPVAVWSEPVVGTQDWQERSVKFDATGFKRFKIVLEHSGPGQSWFDNVTLKRDPSADGAGWHDDVIDWRDRDWALPQEIPHHSLKCNHPKMRNDPKRLVMAWRDCAATSPQLRIPAGEYTLNLSAAGDGCENNLPILEIRIGATTTEWQVPVSGIVTHRVPFKSDGEVPFQFDLKFANDGICAGPTGDIDKNIYIHEISLRWEAPAQQPGVTP
ncbi:MAG: hypothetical protein H6818_02075 [Phycisphaerales bacterium]|nr:hypothetical protein [Phycisphaerales bacterium]